MPEKTRRQFLKDSALAGTCGLIAPSFGKNTATADTGRPNFIFIFCDDLGWADLPCHGYRQVKAHGGWIVRGDLEMPNIDRLAKEGTLFTQFYVSSAVCSPSRTGLMTGRFPSELGIHDYLAKKELNEERGMPDFVDPGEPTVTGILKKSGYRTGHFGKWHLSGKIAGVPDPTEYGIDIYKNCLDGPRKRPGSSEMIADETIAFVRENKNHPFYVNAWLYDPHSPLHPSDEELAPFDHLSPRWGDHKGALQVWYAVLANIDRQIGRILDVLDEEGLADNTVVIFSSDNGPESGLIPGVSHYGGASSTNSGPFRGIKRSLYEGGIREPFIVRWPKGIPAGRVDNETVIGGTDYLPTICSLAGTKPPNTIAADGVDMSNALKGRALKRSLPLMWENRFPVYGHVLHKSPMLAIRDGNWKLLMNPDLSRVELFDIPNDPNELSNRAEQKPEIVERLSRQLLAWNKSLPAGPVHPDAGSNAYPWPK